MSVLNPMDMNMSEMNKQEEAVASVLSSPGGKLVLRFLLQVVGGTVPFSGLLSASSSLWAEIDQNNFNRDVLERLGQSEEQINQLFESMARLLDVPSQPLLVKLLNAVMGPEVAEQLIDGSLEYQAVLMSELTAEEFAPYIELGWVTLSPTGSVASMGSLNRIAGHIEERKRPYGLGNGFIFKVSIT